MNDKNKKFNNTKGRNNSKRRPNRNGSASRSGSRGNENEDFTTRGKGDCYFEHAGTNDPAWYAANPQILTDAASLPFNYPLGLPIPMMDGADKLSAPTIVAVDVALCPGLSVDGSSAINVASRNFYSYVRHQNSGHANYDAPDLMLYCMALDSAYSYYAWMVRLYGIMSLYNRYNRSVPREMVDLMGVNYSDIARQLSDFRTVINQYALKLGVFAAPTSMPIFKRHSWLFSNVYCDSVDPRAQLYITRPTGFYKYVETEGPGKLQFHPLKDYASSYRMTLADIRDYGKALLDPIVLSEDLAIMSGDILKAFGDNTYKIATIASDYTIIPIYDLEFIDAISNASFLGLRDGNFTVSDNDITQDVQTGAIIWNPTFTSDNVHYARMVEFYNTPYRMLNYAEGEPNPSRNMVATRWGARYTASSPAEGSIAVQFASVGSDYITDFTIQRNTFGDNGVTMELDTISPAIIYPTSQELLENSGFALKLRNYFSDLVYLRAFRFTPQVYFYTGPNLPIAGINMDWNHATSVDVTTQMKMDDAAMLSLYNIPASGLRFA